MLIGVDLMGGDCPPELLFQAVIDACKKYRNAVNFAVFCTQYQIDQMASVSRTEAISFIPAQEVILQEDSPLEAIRKKKQSSLVLAVNALRDQKIDALVSIGNTGALITAAALTLKCFTTITRPALLALLPTEKGSVAVVDIGGNVNCTAKQMAHFARIGVAYCQSCKSIERPRVGLLNIGPESLKGDLLVQEVYRQLDQGGGEYTFAGNIEGTDVFAGAVDVLVTDGFTGNVFLKASEGISTLMCKLMRQSGQLDPAIEKTFDYAEHAGALVCGVNGLIVKSHGYSSPKALLSSIEAAIQYRSEDVVSNMSRLLS